MHQYFCEQAPIHVAKATHRVRVLMDDKGRTQAEYLCEQCYNIARVRMVIVHDMPVLSIEDWERILEKNHLSKESLVGLRVLTMQEIGRKKRWVFGVHMAGDYWLLFVDLKLLLPLKIRKLKVYNDEEMQEWSGAIATSWGAMLGLA